MPRLAITPTRPGNSLSKTGRWHVAGALLMLDAMVDPLILTAERLVLRPHRLEDFERLVEMWSHPVVVTHFGGNPFNRDKSWNRLLRYVGHWQ
ncbi:GNAT family N-acetyltransferase, partial [Sandarakinorhabdus sp.]|uniref:GNAT family N-acetyltransferase n=1 Tax=Sandarakinorhabdus sp. TaxID=1916663 RepID=UPI003561D984